MKGCFVDLMGALLIGSNERLNSMGAAIAMGHSSSAYDIDDGHNLIHAHPGTSFVGALLAAAREKNLSCNEFLTALLVVYETTIRTIVELANSN